MAGSPWPFFYVVGAPKSGTTTLHDLLDAHPGVDMPRVKEPHFLAHEDLAGTGSHLVRAVTSEAAYFDLFTAQKPRVLRGDASTSSLYSRTALQRIQEHRPDARIVIVLRDPVQRGFSGYLMAGRSSDVAPTYAEQVDRELAMPERLGFVTRGEYARYVERYLEAFGPGQVLVLLTADLHLEREDTLRTLAEFLGIDPTPLLAAPAQRSNPFQVPRGGFASRILRSRPLRRSAQVLLPYGVRKAIHDRILLRPGDKPTLDAATEARLRAHYAPDIDRLEKALDRRLPSLRGKP